MRISRIIGLLCLALATCTWALVGAATAAARCAIESHPDTDKRGGIAGIPARTEADITPGMPFEIELLFENRSGGPLRITFGTEDVIAAKDPGDSITTVEEGQFGASRWITLSDPACETQHGDVAKVQATIQPPADIGVGSYYAAVTAVPEKGGVAPPGGLKVKALGSVALQLFLNVPGEENFDGVVVSTKSPKLLQRDRGSFVPVEILFQNNGNTTDIVDGTVTFKNIFGGDAAVRSFKATPVLRGGRRELRLVWNSPPWLGRFTPTVTLRDERGNNTREIELDPIWVVPPWPYIAGLLLAIIFGVVVRRWQKRDDWRDYLDDDEEYYEDEYGPVA